MNETTGRRAIHIPGRMVCAVCGRVLDEHEDSEGLRGFAHPVDLLATEDHPAVPVEDTEVHVNEKCDFCFADRTEWLLPAAEFVLPPLRFDLSGDGTLGIEDDSMALRSQGDWGACDPCGQLILANAWPKILRRVRDRWPSVHSGNPMDEDMYLSTYHLFNALRQNITGPLTRIGQ